MWNAWAFVASGSFAAWASLNQCSVQVPEPGDEVLVLERGRERAVEELTNLVG